MPGNGGYGHSGGAGGGRFPVLSDLEGGGLCPGSRDNLRAGRCFFLHSVPDLYQTMKCDG